LDSAEFQDKIGYTLDPYDTNLLTDIYSCIDYTQCANSYYFNLYAADSYWDSEKTYALNADFLAGMDIGTAFLNFHNNHLNMISV
jgi:hypothetical protein